MNRLFSYPIFLSLTLLTACAHAPQTVAIASPVQVASASATPSSEPLEQIVESPKLDLPNGVLTDRLLFAFLVGDLAAQRGNAELAARAYLDLAKTTRDPRVARRAAQLSYEAHQYESSLEAFQLWQELEPTSPLAKQMWVALLLSGGKLEEAKPHVAALLKAEPKQLARSFMGLHTALAPVPNKAEVLDWLIEMAHPYPQVAEAHWVVAQAAHAAGKYELARDEAHQAATLNPDWDNAVMLESQLLQKTAPQESAALLKQYLATHADKHEVRLFYARLLLDQKQYAPAREEFGALLKLRPGNPDLAFAIAMISLQLGELDRAENELRLALEGDAQPKDADILNYYLAQLKEAKKDEASALQYYTNIKGGEHLFAAQLRRSFLLNKAGKLKEARSVLQAAKANNDTQRVRLIMVESQYLNEAKLYEEGFKVLTQGLKKHPNQPELIYQSALTADKQNKPEVFEKLMRQLIKIEPNNAHAYNALGYSLLERNVRLPEAMSLVEKAYQLAPKDAAITDSMGWGYFRLGQFAKSVEFLQRAYTQVQDVEIAAHLGEALWMNGDKAGAQKIWTESLQANPGHALLQALMKRYQP